MTVETLLLSLCNIKNVDIGEQILMKHQRREPSALPNTT